jgi:spectinomycin phosphotransferase
MLEKPDLRDEKIIAYLQEAYGLRVVRVVFLPLGADRHTAVYRVIADNETPYFLKLRSGVFDETSVTLPKFLSDQGVKPIIPALTTKTGQLWGNLAPFTVILYPFVKGCNGYEIELSDLHWAEFGAALKKIHTVDIPPALTRRIRHETYTPQWRETLMSFLERIEVDVFNDPVAVKLAAFLSTRRAEVYDLVRRAERYAQVLQARPLDFVLCHSDVHAGNVLIDTNDAFYIIDWDDPILAPKERDLMFIGGAQGFIGHTPQEEIALFYAGYGRTAIDPVALAYYRYERIVQDIAIYCEQLFLTDEGGEDRGQSLKYLMSNFCPGGTIDIAYQADKILR